jgi:hypothetical protein
VVDQQEAEQCPCALDEAIVIGPIAIAIDKILELRCEPTNPRGAGSGRRRPLRIDKIASRRHETAADVL